MKPEIIFSPARRQALLAAIERAREFVGATAPNPPVGAAAIDSQGNILSVQAHERAGTGHAEAKVLQDLQARGLISKIHELLITLEPCNHHGRTPPCTEAILAAGIPRVTFGAIDPNPRVAGQGAERLRQAGVDVEHCPDPWLREACEELIRPFAHWASTGLPWVVVKTAHLGTWAGTRGTSNVRHIGASATTDGAEGPTAIAPDAPHSPFARSMIPPPGQKTFTSPESLKLAHELRKASDAILTGSGTILSDLPEFTVRHVSEHPIVASGQKPRILVVLDRRGRTPASWTQAARSRGFEVLIRPDLTAALKELGDRGVLQLLVEAGPSLSSSVLSMGIWNRHVVMTQGQPDRIETRANVHWHHPESRKS
jgi:diaminohydroxyphosphoribosylaminopyrimidine deaminase/5-amino-6-(5-phosphoribosylamino)uracil reductase